MIDIGMIVIQVRDGDAIVARCEADGERQRPIPAANAARLAGQAARVVLAQSGTLDEDGCYLCSDDLQEAAVLSPLVLPDDVIPLHEAGALLYPDASRDEAWALLHADRTAGRLSVYRVGVGVAMRQSVSRTAAMRLAEDARSLRGRGEGRTSISPLP